MKKYKIILLVLLIMLPMRKINAQEKLDPQIYNGNLIEYLTVVNIWVEGHMLLNYCKCSRNEDFIIAYQEVRASYNAFLNSYIHNLMLAKSRQGLNTFKQINSSEFVKADSSLRDAYVALIALSKTKAGDCEIQPFLPTVVTIAELTQIATSVLDIIRDTNRRNEEKKVAVIQSLENFKIPSSQAYDCIN
ncbi:hypothetical protein RM545_16580 [Zunongwangia sp. F260]|uniref:Uncharacterized protein n=1 Tax=Autumnicola lenta TaxID=3075593 RepID=A0ABU3CPM7_9FLAO|nr:hypothetical protein [Zunongwangia sp. F260]MDT0648309.1 hypothetical protein [Zunongwangia sp. F260]